MKPLSKRERRLIAIALLLGAVALVWLALVRPIAAGFAERSERRERLALQYAHDQRLIGRTAALRRAAEEQARMRADFAIAAPDAEQGSERLKERLEATLAKAGGELRSSESVEAPTGWVRAGISAVVSHEQLNQWLARLQGEAPYLVIESLTIGADRALNSNQLDLLDVKLEASIPLGPAQQR